MSGDPAPPAVASIWGRWFRAPTREELLSNRWLRPLHPFIANRQLWRTDRGSVARAVAIGLFFGLLIPFAQFLFAIGVAVALRAHVAIAAAATLITNPLTFPPIYWAAYRLGRWMLGDDGKAAELQARAIEAQTSAVAASQGSWQALLYSLQQAGAPLVVGLATFAVVGATLGFVLVWAFWRPRRRRTRGD